MSRNTQLERFVAKHQAKAPKLAAWAADALARVNKAIKRRTRGATRFPGEAACERLITAVATNISEAWVTGRTYLNMSEA